MTKELTKKDIQELHRILNDKRTIDIEFNGKIIKIPFWLMFLL